MIQSRHPADRAYRTGKVLGCNRLELLLMVYKEAVTGCREGDQRRTTSALLHLADILAYRFERKFAGNLYRIYEYCDFLVRNDRFEEAGSLLEQLRQSWISVRPHLDPVFNAQLDGADHG